jgi:hypothetical protein
MTRQNETNSRIFRRFTMKKLTLAAALFSVFSSGVSERSARACDGVIYSSNRVVYSTSAHPAPASPATTVTHTGLVAHSNVNTVNAQLPTSNGTFRVTQLTKKVSGPVVVEKHETVQVVEKLHEIVRGSTLHARVRLAGYQAGEVTVTSGGGFEMQCEIMEWSPNLVTFRIPNVEVLRDVEIDIRITAADRTPVKSVKAILVTDLGLTIEPPASLVQQ